MMKDFDKWNEKKKNIDLDINVKDIYFKEGQIWWCSFGLNIGGESYGKELDNLDLSRVKEKLEKLLKLSNRHSGNPEIEGINPKSNLIID